MPVAVIARPPSTDTTTVLTDSIRRWERRLRLTQTIRRLPLALLIGTLAAIALALASRLRPLLDQQALIGASLGLLSVSAAALLALIWLPRRTLVQSARRFDLLFSLDERISTAVELLTGRIHAPDALVSAQVADARSAARSARVSAHLPVRHDARAWLALTAALIALVVLIALPNPQAQILAQDAAVQAAIDEARDALQDITETVAADTGLTDEERADLLQILDANRSVLQQPNVTPQEAFAAVSEVRSALQETSDLINQRLMETAQALQTASSALSGGLPGESEAAGGSLEQALEALREQAEQAARDQAARDAMIQRLEMAADALEAVNPAAAQALSDAADALRSGDPFAAQEALDRAREALQQQQSDQGQRQGTRGSLDQAAQQAQNAAQALSETSTRQSGEASSAQAQAGAEGQQRTEGDAQQPPAEGSGQPGQEGAQQQDTAQQGGTQGQQGAEGQQSQQGAASSPGDQSAQQQAGGGQGQQAQSAQGGQSQEDGQQAGGLNAGMVGSALSQAGDMAGTDGQDSAAIQQQSGTVSSENNPDGQGEREFEPVFAPRRIGNAPSAESLFLEPDVSDAPIIEGDFVQNAAGQSVVPYDQVFSQYQRAANSALNTGRVPLALRDIIRNYFSSLEPRR